MESQRWKDTWKEVCKLVLMQSNYGRPKLYEYMEISSISCKAYQWSMFKWYHRWDSPYNYSVNRKLMIYNIYICMWKHFHKFLTCNFDTKFLKVLICCFWEKISCMAITYKNSYVNGKHENNHTNKITVLKV